MQIANQFDPTTLKKLKHSALLSLAGFAAVALPTLLPDILRLAQGHPVLVSLVSVSVPFIINSLREFLKGEPT